MSADPSITESKLKVAREKKTTGDAAFKAGDLTGGSFSVLDSQLLRRPLIASRCSP